MEGSRFVDIDTQLLAPGMHLPGFGDVVRIRIVHASGIGRQVEVTYHDFTDRLNPKSESIATFPYDVKVRVLIEDNTPVDEMIAFFRQVAEETA